MNEKEKAMFEFKVFFWVLAFVCTVSGALMYRMFGP